MADIEFVLDDAGHVTVRSSVARTARLTIRSAGAEVDATNLAPVTLPWDDYVPAVPPLQPGRPLPPDDRWSITFYTLGRYGTFGVAVEAAGAHAESCAAIHRFTMPWWRRLQVGLDLRPSGTRLLPVVPSIWVFRPCTATRDTLAALCHVLAVRPDLRARVEEPRRTSRLVRDLNWRAVRLPTERGGIGHDGVDTVLALRRAGFAHEFGRPLRAEDTAPLDEVVAKTRLILEQNPYREGRPTNMALLHRLARRNYTDVKPWPFTALVS